MMASAFYDKIRGEEMKFNLIVPVRIAIWRSKIIRNCMKIERMRALAVKLPLYLNDHFERASH